ncbi:MAG TPA: MerR family transcriptional regulator [Microbacteriaceae bacterium]
MFTIGEFARYGRVSVRMLRHYDSIGLLRPVHVDATNGYRSYEAQQLSALNRIVALKDLGFSLAEVQSMIGGGTNGTGHETIGIDELRGMLALRHSQLRSQLDADAARLKSVELRLRIIEKEGTMPETEVIVKTVPAVRIAELSATAGGYEPRYITPVIGPLYDELIGALMRRGVSLIGPNIAWYEDAGLGDGSVTVHAGVQLAGDAPAEIGATMVELPTVRAATILHHGPMDDLMPTVQALAQWADATGHRATGFAREVYLESPMDNLDAWVIELQDPLIE